MEIKKTLLIFKIKSRIAHQQNVASQRISGGYRLPWKWKLSRNGIKIRVTQRVVF